MQLHNPQSVHISEEHSLLKKSEIKVGDTHKLHDWVLYYDLKKMWVAECFLARSMDILKQRQKSLQQV